MSSSGVWHRPNGWPRPCLPARMRVGACEPIPRVRVGVPPGALRRQCAPRNVPTVRIGVADGMSSAHAKTCRHSF